MLLNEMLLNKMLLKNLFLKLSKLGMLDLIIFKNILNI